MLVMCSFISVHTTVQYPRKMLVTMRFGRIGVTTLINGGASSTKTLTTIYLFLIPRTLRHDCEWASAEWVVQFLRYHQALRLALQERGRGYWEASQVVAATVLTMTKDWTILMLFVRFALFDDTPCIHTLSPHLRRGRFLRTEEEYRKTVTTGRRRWLALIFKALRMK